MRASMGGSLYREWFYFSEPERKAERVRGEAIRKKKRMGVRKTDMNKAWKYRERKKEEDRGRMCK